MLARPSIIRQRLAILLFCCIRLCNTVRQPDGQKLKYRKREREDLKQSPDNPEQAHPPGFLSANRDSEENKHLPPKNRHAHEFATFLLICWPNLMVVLVCKRWRVRKSKTGLRFSFGLSAQELISLLDFLELLGGLMLACAG